MSTTDGRKGHYNDEAQAAAVRASIRGREDEVTRLIWWHLIHLNVPETERAEYAQACWLRALERTRPWDEDKGSLATWTRWIVMAEVTHRRRRYAFERKTFAKPARDRDTEIDHLDERGLIGREIDSRPSVEDSASECETLALVRQMLEILGGDAPGSNVWIAQRHYGEGMSYAELVDTMASEGLRKSSRAGLQHRVEDAVAFMRGWMQSNPAIAEDLHASLA